MSRTMATPARFCRLAPALWLACLLMAPARPAEPAADLKPVNGTMGFTRASFIGVNRNDAEAAFKAFAMTVARRRGYLLTSGTRVFEDMRDMDAAVEKQEVEMLAIDTWEYLSLRTPELVEPQFVVMEQGVLTRRYLVLTRRGSGLDKLADLRGKNLAILENATANLGKTWIETLLLEQHLGFKETFFGKVEVKAKATATVLPVFFGKQHACVVDEVSFNLLKELNPQLGNQLQPVAASEPFVESLLAFSRREWSSAKQKEDMYRSLAELHLEPAGQQILSLFGCSRLLPFEESHLAAVRKLRATCESLRKEAKP